MWKLAHSIHWRKKETLEKIEEDTIVTKVNNIFTVMITIDKAKQKSPRLLLPIY